MEVSDIHPFHQPQNQTLVEITLQIKQLNFREEEKKNSLRIQKERQKKRRQQTIHIHKPSSSISKYKD